MNAAGTPPIERVLAGIGLVLLLAVVVVLLHEALTQPPDPLPRIRLALDRVAASGDGWLAVVRVHNDGEAAAVDITLSAALDRPEGSAEALETDLAELPPHAERRVAFHFESEPTAAGLRLRVVGFTLP